ncbi:MAG: DUF2330 domain-containing protein [Pseudomonadota bacterium]
MNRFLKRPLALLAGASALGLAAAGAFCGFYVAKADTSLFNDASKVVLVRDGDRTVLTMANDFRGELSEFAIVVPVPTVLEEGQINVAENALIDHLDAYTAPRLVEYFDRDPCEPLRVMRMMQSAAPTAADAEAAVRERAEALGVTIEAEYTVGEYDILILSAEESGGLLTWLTENEYRLPDGADRILGSYIKQGVKFFVAKVNLEEQARTGATYLRPLQMAFESPKFMLPIRLGTLNAEADQELFVFALTRTGRIETTNYRTERLPTGQNVPLFVKTEFSDFYRAMFAEQTRKENGKAVFLEYAWDMAWCDPCAADPLSKDELRELGVYWLTETADGPTPRPLPGPAGRPVRPAQPADVFVTRLHVRYNAETFPDDLKFKETGDRTNFQARYVLRHPYEGDAQCEAAEEYRAQLPKRFEEEAQTLVSLTGWDIQEIREKSALGELPVEEPEEPKEPEPWWKRLWRRG